MKLKEEELRMKANELKGLVQTKILCTSWKI